MRQKFETKTIKLVGPLQLQTALNLLPKLPQDPARPLEIVIREQVKARKPDQNAMMWAGPLKDFAEQAVIDGKRFSAEVWHEYLKKEFLPELFDAELCREGYEKWAFTPDEERVLIGSTTMLTVKGMAQYVEQITAFGANLGVRYHANPNERWAA